MEQSKKLIRLSGGLFLLFVSFVLANEKIPFLVFNFEAQNDLESIVFYKEKGEQKKEKDYLIEFNEEIFTQETEKFLDITWQAEFSYPWKGGEPEVQVLREEDLNWTWIKGEKQITGKSSIESCPVILEYFLNENSIHAKVFFENVTDYPVENLVYKFILKYPKDFLLGNQELLLSGQEKTGKLKINSDVLGNNLTNLYEGNFYSAIEYSLSAGTVKPGESSQTVVNLSYNEGY